MAKRKKQMTDLTSAEVPTASGSSPLRHICMSVTWDGEYNRARPLSALVDRKNDAIYFLVNDDGAKNEQLAKYPKVERQQQLQIRHDRWFGYDHNRAKIAELWEKTDMAWWEDASGSEIRLYNGRPSDGEPWDSPGMWVTTPRSSLNAIR
ncbi:MAG: general stress protein [Mesorhizobium sp.]|nr:general stress protein [bacterium M00.F.Ca.ET.205.01.1.1]TGU46703.1 general stress protein [bacterium M00.F.Ca.ET.152.01.1.1]TGV31800.1 general stress protein [Mesorhizobium sp. M00.F.Ca.ET.186.01.1.1]TGZ38967.1 general stress protein [bacterium M00.F.Ca.ET.162.01.1.1]TIW63089.1 MAG: general stress protein [Mesorhizobium sp.]